MNEPEVTPTNAKNCPQCGAPLPAGVLAGLCAACLLKEGQTPDTVIHPEGSTFKPLSIEVVGRLFPQLEILGLLGQGGMERSIRPGSRPWIGWSRSRFCRRRPMADLPPGLRAKPGRWPG